MSIESIVKDFDKIVDAVYDVFADDVNEYGVKIITDDDTINDLIAIMDIVSRVQSRKIRAIKRENESIL